MKSDKNILIAFMLNLFFSVFEFIGGAVCGSVAIVSDAVHDLGDAAGIGFSYFLERKSRKQPDEKYTYGYLRHSVLGSLIITFILLAGSMAVIYNAILRILNPVSINYDGMLIFAVIGLIINFCGAWVTKEGESINQKAVNLHMLEDVLGWAVVLIGAVVMKFTDISVIDPVMSIAVAVFIFINAAKNLREIADLFLEKVPEGINVEEIRKHLLEIDGVKDVHHIHIRSIDGRNNYATMHIVTDETPCVIKEKVRHELGEHGIIHATLELETKDEVCGEVNCHTDIEAHHGHHHHHH